MNAHPKTTAALTAQIAAGQPPRPEPLLYPFTVTDPFQLPLEFSRLRQEEPVCRVQVATGDEVWLVTRYDDVRSVLGDSRFSRNIFRPDAAQLIPGVPTRQVSSPFVDPPAHTRWRKLVTRAFTPRYVEGMRPRVEAIVEELLDELSVAAPPVDLIPAFAYPLSIRVLFDMLGIPESHLAAWREAADQALTINGVSMEEKGRAFAAMNRFSLDLIAAKRAEPGSDFLSHLIGVTDTDDGQLSEEELIATILAMLVGGYESATNQIGKTLLALFTYPDQMALLRERPELLKDAIEESLRFAALDSGFGSPRYALEDVPIGEATIPRGATVLVIRQSADRDSAHFDDPDRFDIGRDARHHHGFGHGPHRCLGAALARLELEVGIGTLLSRFEQLRMAVDPSSIRWDYRITAAGPAELPVHW